MTPRRALPLGLAALAFALPLSIAGTNAALAALSAILLWSLADSGSGTGTALKAAVRSPVFLALAIYAAWEAVSAFGGLDPEASLRLWPKDLHKLWVFLAVSAALAEAGESLVAPALAAGLGLGALIGVGQSVLESNIHRGFVRAHAYIHPVSFGEILGLGLIAAVAFLARPGRTLETGRRRRLAASFIALLTVALLLNETRAILVATAAAYAAACLVEARWRRRALAVLLSVVAVVGFWEVLPTRGRNLRGLFSTDPHTNSQRSRYTLWEIAWEAGLEHPAFGVGSGQYHRAFETLHPDPLDDQQSWSNAHNLYLHQFAERGLPGLLALLAALGALAAGAWRAARARADGWALTAWTATAAFLVMNVTETAWQTEQVFTLYLFLWLLGAGPRPAGDNP